MSTRVKKIMALACGSTSENHTANNSIQLPEPKEPDKSLLPTLDIFNQKVTTSPTILQPLFVRSLDLSKNVETPLQSIAPILTESNENKEVII